MNKKVLVDKAAKPTGESRKIIIEKKSKNSSKNTPIPDEVGW